MQKKTVSETLFVILLITAGTTILPSAPSAMASPDTYFFVDPPDVNAPGQPPGYQFSIDIKVNDAPNTYAWEVRVKWDPNLLSIFLISEGDFLKRPPTNYQTTFLCYPSDLALANQWGNITVGCLLFGGLPMNEWATGNGWLCRLGFEVKATGSTPIDLSDTFLYDRMESGSPASTPYPNVDGFFSNVTSDAYFYVDPPEVRDVQPGNTFSIRINVSEAPTTYAWELHLDWDRSLLDVINVEEGDFLHRWEQDEFDPEVWYSKYATALAYKSLDHANVDGEILIVCSLMGRLPLTEWATGNGWLCTIHFRVEAAGSCALNLSGTRLFDHLAWDPMAGNWYPYFTYYSNLDGFFSNGVRATVNFIPDTLNLKRNAKWIVAYIQPQEGYDAADIDASTILLNGTIAPILDSKHGFVTNPSAYLVDHNKDGILERLVKFDGATVKSWIYQSVETQQEISLTITGQFTDGTPFEGNNTIFVS